VVSTLLFLPNRWPIILSIPVLLFLFSYSFTKRFTSLAHFWLGAALMLAPVCAWIAIRGAYLTDHPMDLMTPIVLGVAVLSWVAGFDILYACQDAEFDRAAKLWSVPSRLGVPRALKVAALCHAGMIATLMVLPFVAGPALGPLYYFAVVAVAVLLVYEHLLVSPDDLGRVNVAFFNVNAIVSIGLFLVVSVDLFI
jgi:4-hydroxybenzoate polyprenyltransferase